MDGDQHTGQQRRQGEFDNLDAVQGGGGDDDERADGRLYETQPHDAEPSEERAGAGGAAIKGHAVLPPCVRAGQAGGRIANALTIMPST